MTLNNYGSDCANGYFEMRLFDNGRDYGGLEGYGDWYTPFVGKEDKYGPFTIDDTDIYINLNPAVCDYILDDYVSFYIMTYDTEGNLVHIYGHLRPWGADWSDFDYVNTYDLPAIYDGATQNASLMYPFKTDWYNEHRYEDFPGLYSI